MRRAVVVALAVAWKDLWLELRSKRTVPVAGAFALLVVVSFALSFDGGGDPVGALWVAFVFAGTVGVMQSVLLEAENDALDGLLLVPVDRSAVYAGKVLSSAAFVTTIGATTLAATVVFLGARFPPEQLVVTVGVIAIASLGFASVAVVVSVITTMTSLSGLLVPVLLVPLLVPVLLAGISLTRGGATQWLTILLAYDGIMFVTGLLVFGEIAS